MSGGKGIDAPRCPVGPPWETITRPTSNAAILPVACPATAAQPRRSRSVAFWPTMAAMGEVNRL